MQSDFELFIDLFIHYLCSRCRMGAGEERSQDTSDGTGRHAHNGEILRWLQPHPPDSSRVFSAYSAYTLSDRPRHLQSAIAQAYNRPVPPAVIHTPETVAAQRLLDHWNETWIRHGIEHPKLMDYTNHQLPFPPKHTRYSIGDQVTQYDQENRYAVDLDRVPFQNCSQHSLDHNNGVPWAFTAGYIPITVFKQHQGQLHRASDRDHLYASSNIPALLFTHIIWDFGSRVQQREHQRAAREQLLHNGLPVIHIRTVQKLSTLITLLNCYADALPLTATAR
jgi:hypothetical protein